MRDKNKTNKKGMIFTLMVIAILSLFLISYTFYEIGAERERLNKRINTLNNYVFSLEKDIPRKLYIAGFRIIFLIQKIIIDTGAYSTDINATFQEAFYNGTIGGVAEPFMNDATYSNILSSINENANKMNVKVNLTNPSIILDQGDPWNLRVTLKCNILIQDIGGMAMWNKTTSFVSYIPVENFEDPLYIVNTGGLVTNKINKSMYQPFADGADVSNLTVHLAGSYYIASTTAPNLLMRMEGNLNSDPNGIESLVYFPKLSSQDINPLDKTNVDYLYFSPTSNPPAFRIQGMPSWFKLDDNHINDYGLGALKIT